MKKSRRNGDKPIGDGGRSQPESGFASALTRVAVAQTCESVGFKRAQTSALDVLANIAALYLKSVAKSAACSANRHGRIESNLSDVLIALEDLSDIQGFIGASGVRSRSIYSSAVIKDLMKFVRYTDEIPFAQPLPSGKMFFKGARSNILKFRGGGDNNGRFYGGRLSYVPRWLPPVPTVEAEGKVVEVKDREPKWGCLDEREEGNMTGVSVERVGNDEGIGTPLSGKRERVRFKIGGGNVKGGGGVCRGGGIGKRVILCSSWSEDAELEARKKPKLIPLFETMLEQEGVLE